MRETGTLGAIDVAGSRGGRRLFQAVGFSLDPGDALTLRGRNGAGKSTLLLMIAGFRRAEAGRFVWNGDDCRADGEAQRRRVNFVGHQNALKPTLSVAENLSFWMALHPLAASLDEALGAFALGPLRTRPCRSLSQGQQRRAALARLAAWWAPLWLLDEPAVGLDDASIDALGSLIARHREAGGIVVVSTHQPLPIEDAATLEIGGSALDAHGVPFLALDETAGW